MSHKISYPSPTAAQVGDGAGPFYTNQAQRVPAHDEIDMSMSMLAGDYRPSDKLGQGNDQEMQHHPDQKFSQMYAQQGHQQMVATPNSGSNLIQGEDSGSKRKPKVSRACDECRRKKVRYARCAGNPFCSRRGLRPPKAPVFCSAHFFLHVALLQPTRSFPRRNPTDTF